jgi:hypothetical protein
LVFESVGFFEGFLFCGLGGDYVISLASLTSDLTGWGIVEHMRGIGAIGADCGGTFIRFKGLV